MKISQLKEVIRTKVRETLYAGANAPRAILQDPEYNKLPPTEKTKVNNALKQKQSVNLEETEEFTMDRIWKMNRNELIKFLGLNADEAKNWGDRELQGAALEMADDKPKDSEFDDSPVTESGTGDQPISSMSREDLLRHFDLDLDTPEEELSTEYLRDAMSGLDEADFIDDDDIVHEGVDDDNTDFKDYDSIYELGMADDFEANVGSGHRGLSVKLHPMDSRFILISQDNGQRVVVSVEDAYELINKLKELA